MPSFATGFDSPPVIIDNGTGLIKCGFGGDDAPRHVFPSVVGRPKFDNVMIGSMAKDLLVGDDVLAKRGVLKLSNPLKHGIITDWDDMVSVWEHTYQNVLRVSPDTQPTMLTEAALNPRHNREQMTEIMFEQFRVPALYIAIQALMALYATGRVTGIVLDIGDGVSHTVPIYEGYCLPHAVLRMNLAGRDLTDHMKLLLRKTGTNFTTSAELDIVRDIKEEHAYVALDYAAEEEGPDAHLQKMYELPDGQVITIGRERYQCPEAIFNPSLLGQEQAGIDKMLLKSIGLCDIDIRSDMYSGIVLSGGSSMFPGLADRLKKELAKEVPRTITLDITALENRKYMVWMGASVLSDLNSFQSQWISSMDYDEHGPNIVHRKCL